MPVSFGENKVAVIDTQEEEHVGSSEELRTSMADAVEAEQLLHDASKVSPFLAQLDAGDVASLAAIFTVVPFDENEQVLAKGEPATWMGIVLSGSLAAFIEGQVVGTMGVGKLLGEVSFFAGGVRLADVYGSKSGYMAFITTAHLKTLFSEAPTTGAKMVKALGASSLHALTHNPREHPPISWNLTGEEARKAATSWQSAFFSQADVGLEDAKCAALIPHITCTKFGPLQPLGDRFAENGGAICFVIEGRVHAVINGAVVHTYERGEYLDCLRYFDPSVLTFDTVGGEGGGVLGGLSEAALEQLSLSQPLVYFTLLRHLGMSAVDFVMGGALRPPMIDGSPPAPSASSSPHPVRPTPAAAAPSEPGTPAGSVPPSPSAKKSPSSKGEAAKNRKKSRSREISETDKEAAETEEAGDGGAGSRPHGGKGSRRGSHRHGAMTEELHEAVEVFHINKLKQQLRRGSVSAGGEKSHSSLGVVSGTAEKAEGLRHVRRRDLEQAVMEGAEAQERAEELSEKAHSLKELVKKLREDNQTIRESEAHFSRLVVTKGKELERLRSEHNALLTELETYRTETDGVHALLQKLEAARKETEEARERISQLETELVEHTKAAQAEVAEAATAKEAALEALEAEHTVERDRLQSRLSRALAEFDETAAKRTMAASQLSQDAAGMRAREAELLGNLVRAQAERDAHKKTIKQQKLAAKALGVLYVMRIGLLRRELAQMAEAAPADVQRARKASLERRQHEHLHLQLIAARKEYDTLKEAQRPLEQSLAYYRTTCRKQSEYASSVAPRLESLERELESATEQIAYMTAAATKADTAREVALSRCAKLEGALAAAKKGLEGHKGERESLAAESIVLQRRVAEMESRFGALCAPLAMAGPPPLRSPRSQTRLMDRETAELAARAIASQQKNSTTIAALASARPSPHGSFRARPPDAMSMPGSPRAVRGRIVSHLPIMAVSHLGPPGSARAIATPTQLVRPPVTGASLVQAASNLVDPAGR